MSIKAINHLPYRNIEAGFSLDANQVFMPMLKTPIKKNTTISIKGKGKQSIRKAKIDIIKK